MKTISWDAAVWLFLAVAAGGCSPYAGTIGGAEGIDGATMQSCFKFQYGEYEGQYDPSKRRPIFAIFWQAHRYGSSTSNGQNLVTAIHGRSIAPSLTKKAAYALQPDYSLKELSLTSEEIDRLSSIAESDPSTSPKIASDPVWQQKVQPFLRVVEPPGD